MGEQIPMFAIWVVRAGADRTAAVPEAFGEARLGEHDDPATANAKGWDDGPTESTWQGSGGKRYDVHPTVYCAPEADGNGDPEEGYWEDANPDWAYKDFGFRSPLTCRQYGNKSLTTTFEEYKHTGPANPGFGITGLVFHFY